MPLRRSSSIRATRRTSTICTARCAQGILPFVGAGLSRPFGFPEWGGFLRAQAGAAGASAAIEARLAKAEYEEAAPAGAS